MVSRFRKNLNRSFRLTLVDGEWKVAKVGGENIFLTEDDGAVVNICTTSDIGQFKYFSESLEYETFDSREYVLGEVMVVSGVPYYVVDSGFRGEDGNVKYMIAR